MNINQGLTNRVLGLTGTEQEVRAKYNTFCGICQRRIHEEDLCLELVGTKDTQTTFYTHTDCTITYMTKLHSTEFRNTKSKKRVKTKREAKVRQGGSAICSFCRKYVKEDQTYIKIGKKNYHNEGTNNCAVRYRRVLNNSQRSLT